MALGRKYRVWTRSGEQRFDGPVRAGEELLLDLTKKKTGGLSITLMDSQGKAIDPSPYQYRLSDKQGGFKTHSFRIVDRKVIIDAVPVRSQLELGVSRSIWKQTKSIAGPRRDFILGGGGTVLASDGTGTISLPCAGDYTVSFRIREDRKDWWKGKRALIRAEPPNQVQIKDQQAIQELHLSQKSIDATLDTLGH